VSDPLDDLYALIERARPHVRRWNNLTWLEKLQRVAEGRRAVASEIQAAYDEQRAGHVEHYLTREDCTTLNRLATFAEWDAAVAEWRANPDHEAAERMLELAPQDPKALEIVASKPRLTGVGEGGNWQGYDEPPYERPTAPPEDCPPLISPGRPIPWDEVTNGFLRQRRTAVESRRRLSNDNRRAEPGKVRGE
jgi:hypothetical protein